MALYGVRQLTDGMRDVRANTILMARDIPESHYDYRPTPVSRSVAETLVHIAWLGTSGRILQEEEHLDSVEGFDFPALLRKSEVEENAGAPRPISSSSSAPRASGTRGGWSSCRRPFCRSA